VLYVFYVFYFVVSVPEMRKRKFELYFMANGKMLIFNVVHDNVFCLVCGKGISAKRI
jgi:hypothetical protein